MTYGYMKNPEAFLVHHGIKGQKWGTRNGPPYPLDDSDHSAREKRLNNGKYSQGVTQDREETAEEHQQRVDEAKEKAKKIAKGVAIGTGIAAGTAAVTTAVAGTAALAVGGSAIAKHIAANPEATKQALKNAGSSLIQSLNTMSQKAKINRQFTGEDRKSALDILKKTNKANALDRSLKVNAARYKDEIHRRARADKQEHTRLVNFENLKKKVVTKEFQDDLAKHPEKLTNDVIDAMQSAKGFKGVNELNSTVLSSQNARKTAARAQEEYKSTHGIRGAYNKAGKTYDKVAGFASTNINRFNTGKNIVRGAKGVAATIGAAGGAYAYNENNKKKKKKNQQYDEYQQYYYR